MLKAYPTKFMEKVLLNIHNSDQKSTYAFENKEKQNLINSSDRSVNPVKKVYEIILFKKLKSSRNIS